MDDETPTYPSPEPSTGHSAPSGQDDRSALEPAAVEPVSVPTLNPRLRRPRRPEPAGTPWVAWAIFAVYLAFSLLIALNLGGFVRAPSTYRYILALVVLLFGLYRLTMGQARSRRSLLDDDD